MAVDTIRLRSPYIDEQLAAAIESQCTKKMAINMKTGNLLYEITTGQLEGSYDSRISVVVKRKEWQRFNKKGLNATINTRSDKPILVECRPYLVLEASVHKLFMGHNIYGGSEDFQSLAVLLIKTVEEILGIELPGSRGIRSYEKQWSVERIDFAYVFHLGTMEAVQQFFYLMKNSYYPRRNVNNYGLSGLYFQASTTALKMYYKGEEFRKHDFKRLERRGIYTSEQLFELLTLSGGLLRVELEIKSRKLKYDFERIRKGQDPYIADITPEYLIGLYEIEIDRVMKEGKKKSDVVRSGLEVEERLFSYYKRSKANALFSAYLSISNFGIAKYKERTPHNTFYTHIRELKEAGISFNLNDGIEVETVTGEENLLPKDFQPLRDDPRRMSGVDKNIMMAIAAVAEIGQKKDVVLAHDAKQDPYNQLA